MKDSSLGIHETHFVRHTLSSPVEIGQGCETSTGTKVSVRERDDVSGLQTWMKSIFAGLLHQVSFTSH